MFLDDVLLESGPENTAKLMAEVASSEERMKQENDGFFKDKDGDTPKPLSKECFETFFKDLKTAAATAGNGAFDKVIELEKAYEDARMKAVAQKEGERMGKHVSSGVSSAKGVSSAGVVNRGAYSSEAKENGNSR